LRLIYKNEIIFQKIEGIVVAFMFLEGNFMRRLPIVLALIAVLFVSACNEDTSYSGGAEIIQSDMAFAPEALAARSLSKSAPPSNLALDRSKFNNRRIAETHNMNVELEPDQLKSRYDRDFQKCVALGCEVSSSNAQSRRSAYINARIAPEKLGEYLDFLGKGPGEIKEHSVKADDKTLQYIDTEAKIKNLERLRDRLITLLNSDKTQKVSEVLQIERELNRVEQQLDSAKGSLRHLATITGKATVNSRYSVPFQDFEVKYYEFKNSFKRGYQEMLNSVSDAIRFVGGILPWIPIWIVGLWITVKAFKFAFGKGFSLLFWKKDNKASKPKAKAVKKS